MPTSKIDLMELFTDTIMQASIAGSSSGGQKEFHGPHSSYFETPMNTMATRSVTLADLLDNCSTLMLALSKSWDVKKDKTFEEIVTQIGAFLDDPSKDLIMKECRTRRLLDYVYPAV